MIATIFTLFLVTQGADVKHTTYDSLKACQEARSLAVYGRTIEQKKADDEAEKKREAVAEAAAQAERDKKYPPRKATAEEMAESKRYHGDLPSRGICNEYSMSVKGDIVVAGPPTCGFSTGIPVSYGFVSDQNTIKTAECVIIPDAKP